MAVLKENSLWPIHSARQLHDSAQQGFLWQFYMTGVLPDIDKDMMILTQSCSIPAATFQDKTYSVGGQEQHYLGTSTRGGVVSAKFIEVEGGKVDSFFRLWANSIDVPKVEILRISRWRRGKGFGDGISGHARSAIVRLIKRNGDTGVELLLSRLQLLEYNGYDLNYDEGGPLTLTVKMVCDDVIRNVAKDL